MITKEQEINYFEIIKNGVSELEKKANEYLSDKEFVSNDETLKRI